MHFPSLFLTRPTSIYPSISYIDCPHYSKFFFKQNPKFSTIGQLVMGVHADEEDMVALGMIPEGNGTTGSASHSGTPINSPHRDDKLLDQMMLDDSTGLNYQKEINLLMKKISANAIDNHSRTIFPVAYAIFNVVYWFYYLYPNNN